MPLTPCGDCGREVSTRAHHCVNCGRPWPGSRCSGWLLIAGIAIAAVAVTGACVVRKVAKHDAKVRADVMRDAERRLELERAEQVRQVNK